MQDYINKKITIIGAARSGIAAAFLLQKQGAEVFVSDISPAERIQNYIELLKLNNIPFECGSHSEKVYDCSLMIISPGVPSDAPVIKKALERKIKIISEIELASEFCPCPIVAVTGSNGKTTTTTLIGEIFKNAGKNYVVAGNIGIAFSSVVKSLNAEYTAILEVSSFQLDFIDTFHPKVSVILNITKDHMDRYDNSIEKYADAKGRIFKNQSADDICIYNYDDGIVRNLVEKARCRKMPFSVQQVLDVGGYVDRDNNKITILSNKEKISVININDISIRGTHNIYNSLAAALVAKNFGISVNTIANTLRNFKGVEHRLEFVREINGIKFINDSKATNVDSVYYALESFNQPVILLLGGRDKGNDYFRLFNLVREKVKNIIAIGESAEKVKEQFQNYCDVKIASSMEEAVKLSYLNAEIGDVVLLSPACASFDWFDNYEHRGNVFKELVSKL